MPESVNLDERRIETTIDQRGAGQRLDRWLAKRFTYHSRNQWQALIKNGNILLNGVKTRGARQLQINDKVCFISERPEPPVKMEYEIIFADDDLLVVNKGGNLPCHPAGPFFKHTLWYEMTKIYGKIFIVNRLDRETSGLMLVAKNSSTAQCLGQMLVAHQVTKSYLTIVHGSFAHPVRAEGILTADPASEVRKKRRFILSPHQGLHDKYEVADTLLEPVAATAAFSLVKALPATGRLHQIRATLYSLGYPMVGDKLYGCDDTAYLRLAAGKLNDHDKEQLLLPRQALHSARLQFTHPVSSKLYHFEQPLPPDMQNFASRHGLL